MRKSLALIMAAAMLILAACGGKNAPPQQQQQPAQNQPAQNQPATNTPAPAAGPSQYNGAYPYQMPPTGHFNTFVTNGITLGIYQDLMEMPMAMYYWDSGKWLNLMGTSWEIKAPNQLIVQLRQGAKWSNGQEFTSQDVVDTFTIGKFFKWVVWRYLEKVEAPDKYTVVFTMSQPASVVERYVVKERIRSSAVYGDWAKKMADVMAKDPKLESDEYKNLRADFEKFRPDEMVVSGPYKIDKSQITESQLTMVKVPTAWNANTVQFDKMVMYNGETPAITPLVLAKEVDYATHGFPPATVMQFEEQKIRVVRPPLASGPALYFNHKVYPFNKVEVRQAIAHAINRAENGVVALGPSGVGVKSMAGFSDNMLDLWISKDDQAKLNKYEFDTKKAEALLTGIGFKKGSDGIWVDDQGKKMEFEVVFPAEYADWSAAAENAAQQLTKFGIKVTPRGITHTQHVPDLNESKYEMIIAAWGAGNPHPHFSYTAPLITYNVNATNNTGMGFDMKQTTKAAGAVDFNQLINDSADGLDEAKQKGLVTNLALAYNELLPYVTLWERYGSSPGLEGVRVTGWAPEGDPIWKNNHSNDNPIVVQILEGRLKGK